MKKMIVIIILRWMAVLPGAILFVFLCKFPIHWFVLFPEYISDRVIEFGNPAKLEYLLYAIFNPFLLIIAAAFIAPGKKFWVGLVVTVLMFLLCLSVMIYCMQKNLVAYSTPEHIFLINIIGCAIGFVYVYNKYWLARSEKIDLDEDAEQTQ